jgi:DNA ligase (NAD+)
LVEDFADFFDLTVDQVQQLDRMAKKRASNLIDAIRESKEEATLTRVIYGLGIPHVGRAVAAELALEFGSLEALANASQEDLEALDGMGSTMASAISQWFGNDSNEKLLHRLRERGLDPREETKGDRLQGLTIVITGSLESMTRDEAHQAIRQQGGNPTSSVSSKTDYLVVGTKPGSAKQSDAKEHGVETIDEGEFLQLIGRN